MPRPTLVVIFQRGGMDGLNAVPPYGDGSYHDLRPFIGVRAPGEPNGALDLDGFFGLHPSLAPLKPLYDAGGLAVVHAAGGTLLDRSHFKAQALMELARPSSSDAVGGWIGRHLHATADARAAPIRGISIGTALDPSMAGSRDVAAIADSTEFRIRSREPELWAAALPLLHEGIGDSYEEQSERVFTVLHTFARAQPQTLAAAPEAEYPEGDYGARLRQAAQYIKADLGIEAITINSGGWDHHAHENAVLPELLAELAQGLAAFRADLGPRFDDVIVVTMSEFGRRAAENLAFGTDHGRGNAMLILGGRVNGGQVFADWPGLHVAALDDGDLRITLDYRAVLAEILGDGFGNPAIAEVFPGFGTTPRLGLLRL